MSARAKVLAAMAVVSLACTTSAAAEEYAFLLRARGNQYWKSVASGIEETAKSAGVSAVVKLTESESDAEEQLNACAALIERKPRLLAVVAVNTASGIQCLKRAAERGILVADIDSSIPLQDALKAKLSLAFSVGSDNFVIGQEAAKFLAARAPGPDTKVLVLEGAAGIVPGKKRVEGFRTKLAELLPQAKVVASLPADWDRLKAATATTDVLQREPSLNVIFAANDVMALGAAEAVRAAGKSQNITIIGVDGTADARKAVEEGRISATVAQLPYFIGKRALELAVRPGKTEFVRDITPTPVFTKESLHGGSDPLLQYVR